MESVESNKRILGILYIISAVFLALAMLIIGAMITFFFDMIFGAVDVNDEPFVKGLLTLFAFLPAIVIIFSVIPSLVAGIGLLAKKDWALTLAMIVGFLKLFSFPVGTALGVYAIWLYFEEKRVLKTLAAKS